MKKKDKQESVKIILAELDKGGYHLFLNVSVNGKKCRFLIDTGASKTVIDKGYFEKNEGKKNLVALKQETAGLHSSVAESYYGKIKELKIGKHKKANFKIAAIDLSHVNNAYKKLSLPKIQGILGSELMLEHKMIVDYGLMKIILP
ncbi:MAG: clan AA aspartic protease [Bacteroidetes bacterium]|nr:clan AA aspartic protease [Bacteroidota bacterium]